MSRRAPTRLRLSAARRAAPCARRRVVVCALTVCSLAGLVLGCSGTEADDGGSTGGDGSSAEVTYCDVKPVVEEYCQRCHGDVLEEGAPFHLQTYADFLSPSGKVLVVDKVHPAVESAFMPPVDWDLSPPVKELSASGRELILQWIEEGYESGGCE